MKTLSALVLSLGLLGGISAQTQTRVEAAPTQQAPASCCKKGKSGETASSCQGKSETAAATPAPSCHGKSETASASCCKGKSETASAPTRENRRNNRQQKAATATRTDQP